MVATAPTHPVDDQKRRNELARQIETAIDRLFAAEADVIEARFELGRVLLAARTHFGGNNKLFGEWCRDRKFAMSQPTLWRHRVLAEYEDEARAEIKRMLDDDGSFNYARLAQQLMEAHSPMNEEKPRSGKADRKAAKASTQSPDSPNELDWFRRRIEEMRREAASWESEVARLSQENLELRLAVGKREQRIAELEEELRRERGTRRVDQRRLPGVPRDESRPTEQGAARVASAAAS